MYIGQAVCRLNVNAFRGCEFLYLGRVGGLNRGVWNLFKIGTVHKCALCGHKFVIFAEFRRWILPNNATLELNPPTFYRLFILYIGIAEALGEIAFLAGPNQVVPQKSTTQGI